MNSLKIILIIFVILGFLLCLFFPQKIKSFFGFLKEKFISQFFQEKSFNLAGFFEKQEKKSIEILPESQKEKKEKNNLKEGKENIITEEKINEQKNQEETSLEEKIKKEETKKENFNWCQFSVSSFPKREIIFNEIAWMGTEKSASDEWMELKNISEKEIDLSGWQIQNKNGKIKIVLKGILKPQELYLLERTSDETLPEIKADLIFTGAILNENESLYLFDKDCGLQDVVEANPDWPAGIALKGQKRTAERMKDLSWKSSQVLGGTPKKENTEGFLIILKNKQNSNNSGGSLTKTNNFPIIYISEVKAYPIEERYVELYNPNDFEVDLTGYYIQRKVNEGDFSSFISSSFFEGKKIKPKSFLLIVRNKEKFPQFRENEDIEKNDLTLTTTSNNTLQLKDPNRNPVDTFSWKEISSGFSFGRKWNENGENLFLDIFEEQLPTPKEKNKSLPPYVKLNLSTSSVVFFYSLRKKDENKSQQIIISNTGNTSTQWCLKDENLFSFLSFSQKEGILEKNSSTTIDVSLNVENLKPDIYEKEILLSYHQPDGSQAEIPLKFKIIITTNDVVINEIAWAGTEKGLLSSDEWLELRNNLNTTTSLNGWKLRGIKQKDGSSFLNNNGIELQGEIPANSFFLLERKKTTDQTDLAVDLPADLTFTTRGIPDDEEVIFELRDDKNQLVDFLDFSSKWPNKGKERKKTIAGQEISLSMERVDPDDSGSLPSNWKSNNLIIRNGKNRNGNDIFGTPKNENSVSIKREAILIHQPEQLIYPLQLFGKIALSKENIPYLFEGEHLIPKESELEIEQGARILFQKDSQLRVEGKINTLKNDSDEEIVFSSAEKEPEFQRYKIYFFQSNGSVLENIKIENGGMPMAGVLEIEESDLVLRNIQIFQSFPYGLKIKNASTTIENLKISHVKNNNQEAVALFILQDKESLLPVSISHSFFSDNDKAIFISSITPGLQISLKENYFENNNQDIVLSNFPSYFLFSNNQNTKEILIEGRVASSSLIIADNPLLLGKIEIEKDAVLTLESGTQVYLLSGATILVKGRLESKGQENLKNLFSFHFQEKENFEKEADAIVFESGSEGFFKDTIFEKAILNFCSNDKCFATISQLFSSTVSFINCLFQQNKIALFSQEDNCKLAKEKILLENTLFLDNEKNFILLTQQDCLE